MLFADVLRPPLHRIAALAPAAGVLAGGAGAGRGLDRGADGVLFGRRPEGLAQLLAIGHEFRFDAGVGPPLAYWLAEIAFRVAGMFGVYVLAQICVVTTYWCVFALGRAIVGPTHAALAVLLMVGISLFTVPSPDFGPPILAMALWAAVLLHYWRAVDPGRTPILVCARRRGGAAPADQRCGAASFSARWSLFTAVTERGRAAARAIEAVDRGAGAGAVFSFCICSGCRHAACGFGRRACPDARTIARRRSSPAPTRRLAAAPAALVLAHAGLAILLVLAGGWPRVRARPGAAARARSRSIRSR